MTDTIQEKIQIHKLLAEDFLNNDTRVAIWDIYGEYYFADIIVVGEDTLLIEAFSPISKIGKHNLKWIMVDKILEYIPKGEMK